jgi:hypothetical protein
MAGEKSLDTNWIIAVFLVIAKTLYNVRDI